MAKGRNRKAGRRTKSGQLSRAGQPKFDKGTEHAQAMRALYGEDCSDAIGRAYQAGLLGPKDEQHTKDMLKTARQTFRWYWRAYMVGPITSTIGGRMVPERASNDDLADKSEHMTEDERNEMIVNQEAELTSRLKAVDRMGVRREFDGLCIDLNADSGPEWLNRLLKDERQQAYAEARGKTVAYLALASDKRMLRAALDGLEAITDYTVDIGIRAGYRTK